MGRFTGRRYTAASLGPATAPTAGPSAFEGVGSGQPVSNAPDELPQLMAFFLPEERPIPSAQIINTLDVVTTSIVQTGVFLPNAKFQVQPGFVAVLTSVTFYITGLLTTTNVTFSVLGNRSSLSGFDKVRIFPGAAARVTDNYSVQLRIPAGALLEVQFNNNDGGNYQVGAKLFGWTWPLQQGDRWIARGLAGAKSTY